MSSDPIARKVLVRILAYIEKVYGPENDRGFNDASIPRVFRGFCCEVSVEVETRTGKQRHVKLVQNYGSEIYASIEEAEQFVLEETGVVVEALPERQPAFQPQPTGISLEPVACFVKEFSPTDTHREAVEAESVGPPRNPDLTRNLVAARRLIPIRRPEE
jgi:hypothetical protein